MAKPAARLGFIQFCLMLSVLVVLGRAVQLQLVDGDEWAERAERARTVRVALPARRGTVFDRSMTPLAVTQESYHVSLAPEQIDDPRSTARSVGRALGGSAPSIERRLRSGTRSVYFAGPYTALDVQPIRDLPGVHLEALYPRIHRMGDLARRTIGALDTESQKGMSGLESALDSVLAGVPGEAVRLKDRKGRHFESPARLVRLPVAGNDVVLTIDARLQEIAEGALDGAIAGADAKGGDVVFMDPHTGELLAVASRTEGEQSSASAFTTPFEPGSTAKLFTAAALLAHDLVDSTDRVGGEDGNWLFQPPAGPPYRITDVHIEREPMNLAKAIEVSSNIGLAKFAQRLTPEQLYEMLRAFGFGTYTGVEFPAESRGVLPAPDRWRPGYDRESISRGYRVSVTAVQLAAAYSAIANGGVLYTPALVREIKSPDGTVLYEHQPEPVRRVIAPEDAATLRAFLRGAVNRSGTAATTQLETYELAGKTGTTRKVVNGRYAIGKYVASFAAIWPAERPQLVAIVTIDEPSGGYYGSQTAAPLTRAMLEEALTSRNEALDFDQLALGDGPGRAYPTAPEARPAERIVPVVAVEWPQRRSDSVKAPAPVPDVSGQTVRAGAATLHADGFRVALRGSGTIVRSAPSAGDMATPGSTVTVWAEPVRLP